MKYMLYSSKFNPTYFYIMLPRLHWTTFLKEMSLPRKSSEERSIILQFQPLGITKLFSVSGSALHWVRDSSAPPGLTAFP